MENLYKLIGGFKQKTFKQNIRGFINLIPSWKKMNSFRSMIASHTKLSPVAYDSQSITTANQRYDVFITGSDQVFNYACSDFDKNYFLSFVKDPRKIILMQHLSELVKFLKSTRVNTRGCLIDLIISRSERNLGAVSFVN